MIAFHLPGGIPIYTFSTLIALGAMTGLAWTFWRAPEKEAHQRVDAGMWALFGGLLGGRLVYIAVNWYYFQGHAWEIIQVYKGGLAWAGALAGGLLSLVFFAWLSHLPLGALADGLGPLLALMAVSTFLGCWLDGCAYGPPASYWWGVPTRDEWGNIVLRLPVQFFGALLTIFLFWLLDFIGMYKKFMPGVFTSLWLLGLSLLILGTTLLRADPAPLWYGMRLDVWAAMGFSGMGLMALLSLLVAKRIKDKQ